MTRVDESVWVRECPNPQCRNKSKNDQLPVAAGSPCQHCGEPAWPHDMILYYLCQQCKTRYLTPKTETREQEMLRLAREKHLIEERLKEMKE
jgi:Ni,Fe-hydrogenase I small subunit